jgi:hypothetical protein
MLSGCKLPEDCAMGTKARSTKQAKLLAMRAERLEEIRNRLADLIEDGPEDLAYDLADLSLSLFAQAHPAEVTGEERERIKHFAPAITDAVIDERAMEEAGVLLTFAVHLQTCRNALQCFPESDCREILNEHRQFAPFIEEVLVPSLRGAFDGAVELGMNPLSVATMTILVAANEAANQGVHWSLLVQPLLTAIDQVTKPAHEEQQKKDLDAAVFAVMNHRGISASEARRYVLRMMNADPY